MGFHGGRSGISHSVPIRNFNQTVQQTFKMSVYGLLVCECRRNHFTLKMETVRSFEMLLSTFNISPETHTTTIWLLTFFRESFNYLARQRSETVLRPK